MVKRILWILVPALLLVFGLTATGIATAHSPVVKAKIKLVGSADFPAVKGVARFRITGNGHRRFRVQVKRANPLIGETLDVFLAGDKLGTLRIKTDGEGKLDLRTKKAHDVPTSVAGKLVEVKRSDGTLVISGAFP